MLAATLFVIAYTFVAALLLRPLARVDRVTAFFATAAGGVADMAIVAKQKGGDPSPVAIVHALRVSVTVAVVPLVVVAFGAIGDRPDVQEAGAASWLLLSGMMVLAFLTVQVLKHTPLPNPWLLGPMLLGLVIGASGAATLVVPWTLIIVAQVMLGTWLGCRFKREVIVAIPRVAMAGLAISLFMIACAGAGAVVLSMATALPLSTAFLALAPAAVTEMVITAKAMQLDPEIITAFHVMRIAIVCSTVLVVFRLYNRLTGAGEGDKPPCA